MDWCTDLSRLNGFEKDLQILAAALDRDYGTELVSSRENHAEFQEQIVKIAALKVEEVLATFYEAENERSQQALENVIYGMLITREALRRSDGEYQRFARSTKHLILALEEFRHLGIDFVSYQENIDTSSPLDCAIFTIISAVAQLERDIIAERVRAGLRRAKNNGKRLGRPQLPVDRDRAVCFDLRAVGKQLGI